MPWLPKPVCIASLLVASVASLGAQPPARRASEPLIGTCGRVVMTVSGDGSTLTMEYRTADPRAGTANTIAVYDRQY